MQKIDHKYLIKYYIEPYNFDGWTRTYNDNLIEKNKKLISFKEYEKNAQRWVTSRFLKEAQNSNTEEYKRLFESFNKDYCCSSPIEEYKNFIKIHKNRKNQKEDYEKIERTLLNYSIIKDKIDIKKHNIGEMFQIYQGLFFVKNNYLKNFAKLPDTKNNSKNPLFASDGILSHQKGNNNGIKSIDFLFHLNNGKIAVATQKRTYNKKGGGRQDDVLITVKHTLKQLEGIERENSNLIGMAILNGDFYTKKKIINLKQNFPNIIIINDSNEIEDIFMKTKIFKIDKKIVIRKNNMLF